jgi:hypothetical protein
MDKCPKMKTTLLKKREGRKRKIAHDLYALA